MTKVLWLYLFISLMALPSLLFAHDYNLLFKPCKSCDWIIYPEPFRLKESCEIARQGVFVNGMTRCEKVHYQ